MAWREAIDTWTETGKNMLALLRDLMLVVLFLMLLFVPAVIGERLAAAGFEEGELLGFKWKKKAEEYGDAAKKLQVQLEEANRTIEGQKQQLDRASRQLEDVQSEIADPASAQRVEQTVQASREVLARTDVTQQRVARTLTTVQPTVVDARATLANRPETGIVLSSDKTLDEARFEARKAAKAGFPGVGIYQYKGIYATISLPESDARRWLSLAQRNMRQDAFAVKMSEYCPATVTEKGYTRCTGV